MANTTTTAPFNFYSISQELVHFRVGCEEENFYAHKGLLDARGINWDKVKEHVELRPDQDGPYRLIDDIEPCEFRGFLHWIYCQELLTEEIIGSLDYPLLWAALAHARPPAYTMAMRLYILGHQFGIVALQRVAMASMFDYFRLSRKVPDRSFIYNIVECGDMNDTGLYRFCVDLYAKWYGKGVAKMDFWAMFDGLHRMDAGFAKQVLERRRQSCPPSVTVSLKHLQLEQYCVHEGADSECRCRRADPMNVIE